MKGTKIWDKTSIIWEFGSYGKGNTNVPVTDWHDKSEEHFHRLQSMRIISLGDPNEKGERQALIELEIFRVVVSPGTERNKIVSLLMGFDPTARGVEAKDHSPCFSVKYALKQGENFSDSAIDRAAKMLKALGVSDDRGLKIANFIILRESLVKTRDGWIPYEDYLRKRHGLKQVCTLWGKTIKIGGLKFSISYKGAESNVFARFN